MTWAGGWVLDGSGFASFMGGKSKDALGDGGYQGALPTGWSFVDVGAVACISVNADGSHAASPGRGEPSIPNSAYFYYNLAARVNLSGTPSLAFCLVGEAADGALCVECGTDGKLRLVTLGASPNRWSGRTALTGWSTGALPLTGTTLKHVALLCDGVTLGTTHCWVSLVLDGSTVEFSLDCGNVTNTKLDFCPNIDNVNAGISVRATDIVGLFSSASAPHAEAWPVAVVAAQHPIGDDPTAGKDAWTGSPDTTDQYNNWDDAAGNDGDTSYNKATTTSLTQRSNGQTAATLGISGYTIIPFGADPVTNQRGPVMFFVHKVQAEIGSKWGGRTDLSIATFETVACPGTSYIGYSTALYRTGSVPWAIADVDNIYYGFQTLSTNHDEEWRVTSVMLNWCVYGAVLPLTTTPSLPPAVTGQRRRGAVVG